MVCAKAYLLYAIAVNGHGQAMLTDYADNILDFTAEESQVWGRLRVPHYENALDKQIAATALIHDLTLVTRNVNDFVGTGVRLFNPFE